MLHGPLPSADHRAGYWLARELGPALRRLTDLDDDQLRAVLTRPCRRLLAGADH